LADLYKRSWLLTFTKSITEQLTSSENPFLTVSYEGYGYGIVDGRDPAPVDAIAYKVLLYMSISAHAGLLPSTV